MNIEQLKDYYAKQTTLHLLELLHTNGWHECAVVKGLEEGDLSKIEIEAELIKEEIVFRTK